MTDDAPPLAGAPLASFAVGDKSRAFRAAGRHSLRVKVLRVVTIGGALSLAGGIVLFTILDPFHSGRSGVSIDGVAVDGTKVTMARPRLSGYRKDGRPYTITASAAVQDVKAPTIFELHDLQAVLTQTDKSSTKLSAATGIYDSTGESLNLTSAVHIVGDTGLDVRTQDAQVSFKTNAVVTDKPVSVAMRGSTVDADRMQVVDGGKHVTFEGNVHSVLVPDTEKDAAAAPPADAAR